MLPETAPERDGSPDWEEFYKSYRKPGYVSGYELLHKLGGGVFGIVYKARKLSINKPYAIKFLKVDDPAARDQILKELDQVHLFAQVDHPNLVTIEDKGVVDGIPFIVMGYAGEETLKSRMEEERFDEEEALAIFVQMLRGVQALHDHSLVHFDLKPANIFLKGDVARVGDYGLSKLVSQSMLSLTTGRGTPYYMAPEMLKRRGDHRSDIYSLGVMFYECLAGTVPFTGDNEWEVLMGHEKKEVEFPGQISTRFRPLLRKMMAKQPEDRHQSLAEVLRDLQAPGGLGESIVLDYGLPRGTDAVTSGERLHSPEPPPIPSAPKPRIPKSRPVGTVGTSGRSGERLPRPPAPPRARRQIPRRARGASTAKRRRDWDDVYDWDDPRPRRKSSAPVWIATILLILLLSGIMMTFVWVGTVTKAPSNLPKPIVPTRPANR